MKKYILILIALISLNANAQVYDCCPQGVLRVTVTLNKTQINNLHTTPVLAIIPEELPTGLVSAVRWSSAPEIHVKSAGTPFIFSDSGSVLISNGATGLGLMGSFSSPCIISDGVYIGLVPDIYKAVTANIVDGKVWIYSTSPITGGGATSKMVFTFYTYRVNY